MGTINTESRHINDKRTMCYICLNVFDFLPSIKEKDVIFELDKRASKNQKCSEMLHQI